MHRDLVLSGRYVLERPIASGGMGSIWVARRVTQGGVVAVKLMDPQMADVPELRARFVREAKAASAIQSPHVVEILDHGVDGRTPYLVMELLEGEDLRARIQRKGRLPLDATARIVEQIALGLERAHAAGVVHRDLKPGNIFLARDGEGEVVKILDFGIAKVLDAPGHDGGHPQTPGDGERTATGVVLGSLPYMSPEQARGYKNVDHRTDLWSLAVIAYRALTGRMPFEGDAAGDVYVKLCCDPIPTASDRIPGIAPEVGRQLDRFFVRGLMRNPAERFQTALDLSHALTAIARIRGPLSVEADPPTLPVSRAAQVTRPDLPETAAAPVADTAPAPVVQAVLRGVGTPPEPRRRWPLVAAVALATLTVAAATSVVHRAPLPAEGAPSNTPSPESAPPTPAPSVPSADAPTPSVPSGDLPKPSVPLGARPPASSDRPRIAGPPSGPAPIRSPPPRKHGVGAPDFL